MNIGCSRCKQGDGPCDDCNDQAAYSALEAAKEWRRSPSPETQLTLESRVDDLLVLDAADEQAGDGRITFAQLEQITKHFNARRGAGVAFPMQ